MQGNKIMNGIVALLNDIHMLQISRIFLFFQDFDLTQVLLIIQRAQAIICKKCIAIILNSIEYYFHLYRILGGFRWNGILTLN